MKIDRRAVGCYRTAMIPSKAIRVVIPRKKAFNMDILSHNRDGNTVLRDALAAAFPHGADAGLVQDTYAEQATARPGRAGRGQPMQDVNRESAHLTAWSDSATSKRAAPATVPVGGSSPAAPVSSGALQGGSPFGGFYR